MCVDCTQYVIIGRDVLLSDYGRVSACMTLSDVTQRISVIGPSCVIIGPGGRRWPPSCR